MFLSGKFNSRTALNGTNAFDHDSHRTLYCGVDPADDNRVLIRKLIQINTNTYAYEETRITRHSDGREPDVHTTLTKCEGFNLKEKVGVKEHNIRQMHRPMPNALGYSLYYRGSCKHLSIVENSIWKASAQTWREWWQNLADRRDMSTYLYLRWYQQPIPFSIGL